MTDRPIVYVVDDDDSVRRSLSFLLNTSGYRAVTFISGTAFLKEARQLEPGCVLLDIRMPEIDGLEVQAEMNASGIMLPVIVMTGHGEIELAVRAMKAGAIDFLEKPFEKAALIAALKSAGDRLDRGSAADQAREEALKRIAALTARERDVLAGLAHGLPNKTIGYDLGISARTVEVHRAHLMEKLDVRSLADALRLAFAASLADEWMGQPRTNT